MNTSHGDEGFGTETHFFRPFSRSKNVMPRKLSQIRAIANQDTLRLFCSSSTHQRHEKRPLNDILGERTNTLRQTQGSFLRKGQFGKSANGSFDAPAAAAATASADSPYRSLRRDVPLSRFVFGTMPELQRCVAT